MITDVDDMLESYFVNEFDVPKVDMGNFVHIKTDIDFRQISLVFMDNQIDDVDKFLKKIEQSPDYIGIASDDQFETFCAELKQTQKVMDVKNVSAAVGAMVNICNDFFEENGYEENEAYVPVRKILGGETCSKKAGGTIKKAVEQMVKNGEAESRWKAIEKLAEEYLDGKKH